MKWAAQIFAPNSLTFLAQRSDEWPTNGAFRSVRCQTVACYKSMTKSPLYRIVATSEDAVAAVNADRQKVRELSEQMQRTQEFRRCCFMSGIMLTSLKSAATEYLRSSDSA